MDNLNLTTSAIADRQRPISAVFEQPRSAKQWEQYVLPAWQISFFEKNGFLNGIKIMTDQQAQKLGQRLFALQSRIKSSSNGHQPGGALATKDAFPNRAGSLKVLPEYIDMICSPAYRMATYQLLGVPSRFFRISHTADVVLTAAITAGIRTIHMVHPPGPCII